jgi:uncharacterized membrane protein YoaK (UPF0700 family)
MASRRLSLQVAGAVNACGVRALGIYAATITPAATEVGTGLATQRPWLALEAFVLVASFGIGAFIAATLQLRASQRAFLAWPLLAEAAALVLFVALWPKHGASYLLTCAMGIQNASLTQVHGRRIRTTHVTSVWTDAGHDLAIAALAWRSGRVRLLARVLRRLAPRILLVVAFLIGAIAAFWAYSLVGTETLLLAAGATLGIAARDFKVAAP